MTVEIYLRRTLLAPIVVPMLAGAQWIVNETCLGSSVAGAMEASAESMAIFLLLSLGLGGLPYLWMLHARRDFFRNADERGLVNAWRQLPLEMIPYYWKFWGSLTLLFLITIWGALYGVVILIAGTIAIPILGYLYVTVTFGFLRIFQCFGLIGKGTT